MPYYELTLSQNSSYAMRQTKANVHKAYLQPAAGGPDNTARRASDLVPKSMQVIGAIVCADNIGLGVASKNTIREVHISLGIHIICKCVALQLSLVLACVYVNAVSLVIVTDLITRSELSKIYT